MLWCNVFCSYIAAERVSSTLSYSSSSLSTSDWFWDDNTASRESTPSLETTTASSFSTTSSWDWDWGQETSSTSITSSFSSSSTSSAEEDWYVTPTSTVIEATSSVPSLEMLFFYMYEALEHDHLGMKRKRRQVKEPSLQKKRDVAAVATR